MKKLKKITAILTLSSFLMFGATAGFAETDNKVREMANETFQETDNKVREMSLTEIIIAFFGM
jgi:hypothetical protein